MNYHRRILTSLTNKNVYIRHDIDDDRDLDNILNLIEFERSLGLKSITYTKLEDIHIPLSIHNVLLRTLRNRDFHAGLHIDIDKFLPSGIGIKYNILRQLNAFYPINMTTCSGHGRPIKDERCYTYEIWNTHDPRVNVGLGYLGEKLNLSDFGFTRDVSMLLPWEFYLGDSMGKWFYWYPGMSTPVPNESNLPTIENPMEIINKWKKTNATLQVLIHPQYFS